jgi:phage terminase small subunit
MALTAKQEAFAVACAKGETASDAYRGAYDASNMSATAVHVAACRLLKNPKVTLRVEELRAPAVKATRLEIEETLRECACVLYSDPRRFYREDGSLKAPQEWDDDMAACVASVEVREVVENGKVTAYVKKIKFWSKLEAMNMAMRYAGLFDRDNRQLAPNLAIQVNLVEAPSKASPGAALRGAGSGVLPPGRGGEV